MDAVPQTQDRLNWKSTAHWNPFAAGQKPLRFGSTRAKFARGNVRSAARGNMVSILLGKATNIASRGSHAQSIPGLTVIKKESFFFRYLLELLGDWLSARLLPTGNRTMQKIMNVHSYRERHPNSDHSVPVVQERTWTAESDQLLVRYEICIIISFIIGGVGLSPRYCGHFWPIVQTPDDRWGWL
jgi:hypothetical protein